MNERTPKAIPPASVIVAFILIVGSHAAPAVRICRNIALCGYESCMIPVGFQPAYGVHYNPLNFREMVFTTITVLWFFLILLSVLLIGARVSWARYLYSAQALGEVLILAIATEMGALHGDGVPGAYNLSVYILMQILSVVLLFHPASNRWFHRV